jgi:hypothetical protein
MSLLVVGLWAVSRSTGLPVGGAAWTPEPVGALDVAATADEVLLAVAVALRLGAGAGAHGRVLRLARGATGATGLVLIMGSSLMLLGGHAH